MDVNANTQYAKSVADHPMIRAEQKKKKKKGVSTGLTRTDNRVFALTDALTVELETPVDFTDIRR